MILMDITLLKWISTELFTKNYETIYLYLRNCLPKSTKSFTNNYETIYLITANLLSIKYLQKS